MKRRTGKVVLAIVVVICFALTAACGSQSTSKEQGTENTGNTQSNSETTSTPSEEPAKPKEPVTITMASFNQWYNDGVKAAIAKYEEVSGNKVKVEVYPDDQFVNLILAKLATGDVPDVIGTHPNVSMYPGFLPKVEALEGRWVDKVLPATRSNIIRPTDNKVVVAPYGAGASLGAIYNKEIFKNAGVKLPLKNYSELLAAAEAIKKTGVTPIYLPNKDNWTAQIFLLVSLNAIFEKDSTLAEKIMTNQVKPSEVPEIVDMVNRLVALRDKGYINDDHNSATFQMAEKAVANGEAAMFMGGGWLYADFVKDYPDKVDNIGLMPITLDDNFIITHIGPSGSGLWVPSEAKNKEAAKEFVNLFMTEEVLNELYKFIPGISPIEGYKLNMGPWDEEVLEYSKMMPVQDDFKGAHLQGFNVGLFSAHIQAIFNGTSVTQALDDWYEEYSKVNKAAGIPGF